MEQKGINLRDLKEGDFVKVRKAGEWFNREGFVLKIVWAKRSAQITVAIGIDEAINASKGLDAQKIIKEIVAPLIKGGGGGQKLLAAAGGQDTSNLSSIIEKVKSLLNN